MGTSDTHGFTEEIDILDIHIIPTVQWKAEYFEGICATVDKIVAKLGPESLLEAHRQDPCFPPLDPRSPSPDLRSPSLSPRPTRPTFPSVRFRKDMAISLIFDVQQTIANQGLPLA